MTEVRLAEMTEEQYGPWREASGVSFAQSVEDSGVPPEEAARRSAKSFADLLPEGLGTAGQHLWNAYDGDLRVGFLWIQVKEKAAFVYELEVEESLRRRGYGRAIMEAGERWCRTQGVTRIGLHVFAHNPGARTLYETLGYAETSRNMAKDLS